MPKVTNFNINKFSIYRNESWFHHPQRSELSLNVIKNNNELNVCILWKNTNLDEFTLSTGENCTTTLLTRNPCLGLKQCDSKGNILLRFQISLTNHLEFEQCYKFIQQELNVKVTNNLDDPVSSQSFQSTIQNDSFSQSQTLLNSTPQIYPQSQIPSQNQFQNYQPIFSPPIAASQNYLQPLYNPRPIPNEARELSDLLDMPEYKLNELINQKLKDPQFIQLVERVKEIINKE